MNTPDASLSATDRTNLEALARAIERDRDVLFITGAGLSADSGLPTYRGVGGLYEGTATASGMSIEEALHIDTFKRRPHLTWHHIRAIADACAGAHPNRGHHVIAAMEQSLDRVVVLTQNVDGFHHKAGSQNVIQMHGNLERLACTTCGWSAKAPPLDTLPPVPRCPVCASIARPPVVLFGEALPADAVQTYEAELARGFSAVVSVGTSSLFPYISAPVQVVQAAGGLAAEINPSSTAVSPVVD
ncbi:MAG TPA: NAD-dependent protein deacylase, partial [Deltaproteobacteria bacterium]|nr:NAD-dependent protein deacylase [Deltaproteobacteria bacterium]